MTNEPNDFMIEWNAIADSISDWMNKMYDPNPKTPLGLQHVIQRIRLQHELFSACTTLIEKQQDQIPLIQQQRSETSTIIP